MNAQNYETVFRGIPNAYPEVAQVLRQVEKLRLEWVTAKKRAKTLTEALDTVVEIAMERGGMDFVLDEITDRLERTAKRVEELSCEMYALEGVLEDAVWASEGQ